VEGRDSSGLSLPAASGRAEAEHAAGNT